ncbi:SRPBCC family protein [Pseudoalteromonas denitrificans]|uniref:Polyketide cyclase / dehydrase and lipid transport n=1 Tax=Pseudoalteromonas denitrificans DSM 6059 TaxID=1123010 RepID=A0A1I1KGG9_9GAMM|nr:SRPBCC family protein [Pseudoalteromonas denitrificans]SFC56560.1 Polyketide cyclase / dehydrase and lipid transport [Pseudoalteromonas denitrificans DSM 6059]
MAHHCANTLKVNVSAEKIWQVLEDYSGIEKFAMTIKSSASVNDISSGLGAKRSCTFNDGSSLVEEIIEYQIGQGYKMDISNHSMPLKSMQAEMKVNAIDANSSEIYMSADFVVKGGPLGWVMGQLLMRPVMKGIFKKVMTGLAYHSVTGELVGKKLPANEALTNIIIA